MGSPQLEIVPVTLPEPVAHQVVVRLISSGVCHSQLHQLERARVNPVVLGHEGAGLVLAVGSDVEGLSVGDGVLVTWIPRQTGERRPEPARIDLGDGTVAHSQNVFTWADTTIVDEAYVVPVSDPVAEDCIIACAVMTGAGAVLHTAGVPKGATVAVFGAGGVGLSAIAAARQVGARTIIAVDLQAEKLKLAGTFGATDLVNAADVDAVESIRALTTIENQTSYSGDPTAGVDFAFDCIGLPLTMAQCVASSKRGVLGSAPGGTAVLVGAPTQSLELDVRDMLVNEKRFIGSLGGSTQPGRDLPVYVEWSRTGALDLDALVTDRVGLHEVNEALSRLRGGGVVGRAILDMAAGPDAQGPVIA